VKFLKGHLCGHEIRSGCLRFSSDLEPILGKLAHYGGEYDDGDDNFRLLAQYVNG